MRIEGTNLVPSFIEDRKFITGRMINKDTVSHIVEDYIRNTEHFIVDIKVSQSNQIKVIIDHFDGVSIDFCVSLTKEIEGKLDREIEDYDLEVSSSGLTTPFSIPKQYEKNIGNQVEVMTIDHKKIIGTLIHYEQDKISLEIEVLERPDGEKRKKIVKQTIELPLSDIKTTKQNIRFK